MPFTVPLGLTPPLVLMPPLGRKLVVAFAGGILVRVAFLPATRFLVNVFFSTDIVPS